MSHPLKKSSYGPVEETRPGSLYDPSAHTDKPTGNCTLRRLAWSLGGLVAAFVLFGAGVAVGIAQENQMNRWTQNVDLSDYISLALIGLLSIALALSLLSRNK